MIGRPRAREGITILAKNTDRLGAHDVNIIDTPATQTSREVERGLAMVTACCCSSTPPRTLPQTRFVLRRPGEAPARHRGREQGRPPDARPAESSTR